MPREKAEYRALLERLDAAFPDRETLKHSEIAEWLGVSTQTVRRRYGFPRGRVSKTAVARAVAR